MRNKAIVEIVIEVHLNHPWNSKEYLDKFKSDAIYDATYLVNTMIEKTFRSQVKVKEDKKVNIVLYKKEEK